jgi:hypothetical protein
MVELFGSWVKYDAQENFVPAEREDSESFMETIGVETVYPQQLRLVKPAQENDVAGMRQEKFLGLC